MPQTQGAGKSFVGGPGGAERGPWYSKIFTGIGGVIKYMLLLDAVGFQYETVQDGLVAHAGGGQANATPIPAQQARFTTVATNGDSALLPATAAIYSAAAANVQASSASFMVVNAGVASMNVFPSTGEQINSLGANAAFAVAAGKVAVFYCTSIGQWHAMLSA
ncbi:MAG TPA: hypothetical protein VKX49_26235 [Bryobacteraceae bacterium]|nr:hypothetical protein [Bryobacteraceae bacterium]